jgi:hypothetical protein
MADRPEKEKKRKRDKDGPSKPNKRVAIEEGRANKYFFAGL